MPEIQTRINVCGNCGKTPTERKVVIAHFSDENVNSKHAKGEIYRHSCGCCEMVYTINGVALLEQPCMPRYGSIEELEKRNPNLTINYN